MNWRYLLISLLSLWVLGCVGSFPSGSQLVIDHPLPVHLKNAHGVLSSAQSQAILDRLRRDHPESDILQRHLALEEVIGSSPLTVGNQVTLLQDGPATYQAMFKAIQSARDHIHLETYILEDDEVGRRFAQALIDKQRQGVQVSVIYDSVGTWGTSADFFENLKANGIALLEFNPINPLQAKRGWELNQRNHRKLLIVDGRTAFLGGINISSVYSGGSFSRASKKRPGGQPPWRDTHLQLQGPVVAELQKLFLTHWQQQQGAPLTPKNFFPELRNQGQQIVRAIGSSPDEPMSVIYTTLLSAINSAETSIEITNAYFAPDPQLISALQQAARRGVEVKLILPSTTDSWLVVQAGRSHYENLLGAGVKIYQRREVILHAKTVLIDGVWATVGSTNLDWRSFLHNDELDAVVLGADFGKQLHALFEQDLKASNEITLAQWQQRPLKARMQEWFARLWEYWL